MAVVFLYESFDWLREEKKVAEQAVIHGKLCDSKKGFPVLVNGEGEVYGEIFDLEEQEIDKLYMELCKRGNFKKVQKTVKTDTNVIECLTFQFVEDTSSFLPINRGNWKEYNYFESKPERTFYFAYGSCMDTERMQKAGVDHHFQSIVGAGKLENYTLRFSVHVHDGGRADIVEEGGKVEGILYEVPFEAVEYLYVREGVYTNLYRPTFVNVEVNGVNYENCLTFVVCSKKEDLGPPDHYKNEILRGSKGRVTDTYYEKIKQYMENLQQRNVTN